MQKELNEVYNLKIDEDRLSFQPNRRYKNKIIACVLLAIVAFVLPRVVVLGYQGTYLVNCLGLVFAGYAVYDFLFRVNLTYIFDQSNRRVYCKIPGFYTRKLMAFEEVYILLETLHFELHYVMANKKNRFGRNYPISDYFTDSKKGRREQEQFEIEILTVIEDFMATNR